MVKQIETYEEVAEAMKACSECGIRFVVFDGPEGTGSWYMPFQTNGISADELPIEVFMNDAFFEWAKFERCVDHLNEITHFDTTDDPGEIYAGYSYENLLNLKINRLVQYV